MTDGKIDHPPISNIRIHGWNLIYRTIINLHVNNLKSHIISVLDRFLDRYNLDNLLKLNLIKLQDHYIIDYPEINSYPKQVKFDFDIYNYIIDDGVLHRSVTIQFNFPERKNMRFEKFLELLYYSRRRNFGKSQIKILC